MYLYQKGDYESMRKDTLEFAQEKYFNGHSDTRSVQENFDLIRDESFITSWGGGGAVIFRGGVGIFFGDVLGGGVENKMTNG